MWCECEYEKRQKTRAIVVPVFCLFSHSEHYRRSAPAEFTSACTLPVGPKLITSTNSFTPRIYLYAPLHCDARRERLQFRQRNLFAIGVTVFCWSVVLSPTSTSNCVNSPVTSTITQ